MLERDGLPVELGVGNDAVRFKAGVAGSSRVDVPLTIDGGEGGDDLHGGTANDVIRGGPGLDDLRLRGRRPDRPGTGFDQIDRGHPSGEDTGADTVSYAERAEPLHVGSATGPRD